MNKVINKFTKKQWAVFAVALVCVCLFTATTVYAAGDVSTAITSTWNSAKSQIKTVVNNVVFPVVDTILAVLFFVKIGTAYFDYRKHGQFEFAAPAILFACLIFTLTAPLYIWGIVGIYSTNKHQIFKIRKNLLLSSYKNIVEVIANERCIRYSI